MKHRKTPVANLADTMTFRACHTHELKAMSLPAGGGTWSAVRRFMGVAA